MNRLLGSLEQVAGLAQTQLGVGIGSENPWFF